jgi:hypothetical protein
MTKQDCQRVYQELAQMLRETQLGWIVEQVETLVNTGKTFDVDLLSPQVVSGSISPHAVLSKPETYTAQEQLLLLIDTAERLVVDTANVEGALVDFLSEEEQRLNAPVTLEFASEDASVIDQLMVNQLTDRRVAAAELRQLLQALRQEVVTGV